MASGPRRCTRRWRVCLLHTASRPSPAPPHRSNPGTGLASRGLSWRTGPRVEAQAAHYGLDRRFERLEPADEVHETVAVVVEQETDLVVPLDMPTLGDQLQILLERAPGSMPRNAHRSGRRAMNTNCEMSRSQGFLTTLKRK